jgi:hypothetical protein
MRSCPIRDSGMVVERPTVTTMGEVSSTAYAHAISESNELNELICVHH